MPTYINPNAAGQNFYNPYGNGFQYGSQLTSGGYGSGINIGSLASGLGGAVVGGALNLISQGMQNRQQEYFYNQYMSPAARMEQMREAGINPNLAAQGISGASAPQMTAAQPTGAFTGIGEQLGASVNNALTAESILTSNQLNKANRDSILLDNDIKRIELGMKPQMMEAELEDVRSRAAQQREQVNLINKEIEKYSQEIDNLKEEKNLIIAQEGEIEYRKKLEQAETNKANAEAQRTQLTNKYGVAPGDEKYNYYKACVEYGEDSEQAKKELSKLYNTEYSTSRGAVDANPVMKNFNSESDAIDSLNSAISQCGKNEVELYRKFSSGEIDESQYRGKMEENDRLREDLRSQLKGAKKAYSKSEYKTGYHTQWQDKSSQLIDGAFRITSSVAGAVILSGGLKGKSSNPIGFHR